MKELIERLGKLTDTRRQWGNLRHKLVDIVFIGLVSVICGVTDFEHMEDRGYIKVEWFKKRLEMPNGIPDSDTRDLSQKIIRYLTIDSANKM